MFAVLAEGGGFEPPVRLPVRQFSKLLVSATHPSFLPSDAFKQSELRLRHIVPKAVAKVQYLFYIHKKNRFFLVLPVSLVLLAE